MSEPRYTCELCGDIIKTRRSKTAAHHFCCREHVTAWQQQTGHFKKMAEIGHDARVAAVIKSNSAHPRKPRTCVHCAHCDKVIPQAVLARRGGRSAQRHFCDDECRKAWQKQSGFYSKISAAGKAARSAAIAQSNKEKPRRRK